MKKELTTVPEIETIGQNAQKQKTGMSTARTRSLKEQSQKSPMEISTARARIFTEAFRQNADRPLAIRRALAFQSVLEKIPIRIYKNELLVGGITEKRRGAFLFPETKSRWMLEEIDSFESRPTQALTIGSRERRELMKKILPFWRGNSAHDKYLAYLSEENITLQRKVAFASENQFVGGVFLFNANYGKVVHEGLDAIVHDAEIFSTNADLSGTNGTRNAEFYEAVAIAGRAVMNFSIRYAALAESLARKDAVKIRKEGLLEISEICRRVPAYPAQTFREGLQSIWFTYLGVLLDDGGMEVPFGRMDQILGPLYDADLASGRLTRADALELLEAFCVKASEIVFLLENAVNLAEDGNTGRLTVTIGGVDREGRDATNEVSYLFLEAAANSKTIQPNLAVRLHPDSPKEFIKRVVSGMTSGSNNLNVFNDQTIVTSMVDHGFSIEDARDYIITGCVQPAPASTYGSMCAAHINGPKTLELMISDHAKAGTLASFSSFEEFLGSYKKFVHNVIQNTLASLQAADRAHDELLPNPFVSLVMDGPTETGRDVKSGGARNNITGVNLVGVGTLADSLAAVKKIIFEEKRLALTQLHKLMQENFEGNEQLRLLLQNGAPKFGNDEEYVDHIARDLVKYLRKEFSGLRTYRGGRYGIGLHSEAIHVLFGMATGATPDGKKAGQPLSVGGGPAHGRDVSGYTACLKSVASVNPVQVLGGSSNNLRFHPALFSNFAQVDKFKDLLLTYFFDLGGQQLQINVVSSETLKDAQQHPEKYGDLLVRVSGYSARFVDLTKPTQNEIIARTEYGAGTACT
jgi:formate C-acetyltransferase